jgi:acyl dehydratase
MVEDAATLREQLEAYVGQPMSDEPSVGPDPVNQPMIRHWVDAMDDRNPVYEDVDAATSSRFGGIVSPPAMLQTWTFARPVIQGLAERGGANRAMGDTAISALDRAGYTSTRATDSELEFVRYLRLGDEVQAQTVVESISDEKQTALGRGFFLTWLTTYTDRDGEVVGRQRFRILKFRPGTGRAS